MLSTGNDDPLHAPVHTRSARDRALVTLADSPDIVPDSAINALRDAIVAALAGRPRCIVLDLLRAQRADSRLVALTCDAMRLCRRHRVRLVVRCTPELRAWLIVYHIPGLRRVLEVRDARPPSTDGAPADWAMSPAA